MYILHPNLNQTITTTAERERVHDGNEMTTRKDLAAYSIKWKHELLYIQMWSLLTIFRKFLSNCISINGINSLYYGHCLYVVRGD